eukprot:TRINITY_DN263_c0_g1_i2.p1 TRINITY_DN263_c0_g1~~TRINITY_DN263_c0_g1_i2.p1  ORF type:complete len:359 (-),score=59.04 TRINITY_DN263_c0_g1_i2:72-1064(-)
MAKGFIAAAIAVVCFGSNFAPVKKFESGDGVFFQWILCSAIWVCGFIVNFIRGFPPFEPLALLGGVFWCSGNMLTVPIIKLIGLSLGLLLWGMANLCMGWLSGTLGLFGLKRETVKNPTLNYVGFVIAVCSTFIYFFVKPNTDGGSNVEENGGLINQTETVEEEGFLARMSPLQKRVLGFVLSVVAGIFYGVNFDPVQYIMDHHPEKSQNGLDYVFSHFCGIYLASTFYFIVYCILKGNKPIIFNDTAFPAFVSGLLWAVADISWFVANSNLELVVAFPIITTGPGVVAALWGIFVFDEIKGFKNYAVLITAFIVTITAVIMIALSQVDF